MQTKKRRGGVRVVSARRARPVVRPVAAVLPVPGPRIASGPLRTTVILPVRTTMVLVSPLRTAICVVLALASALLPLRTAIVLALAALLSLEAELPRPAAGVRRRALAAAWGQEQQEALRVVL